MTDEAAALPNFYAWLPVALLQRSGTIAFLVLLAVVLLLVAVSPNRLSYFDLSTISASGTTLALASIGETIVVLGGGLDLSPGAVISLVNVVLVTQLGSSDLGVGAYTALATVVALSIGAGVGAINGLLVSYLRLPSIIVTLATMFVVQGAALLILKFPGGSVSGDFANLLVGDVIPDVLPVPILIIDSSSARVALYEAIALWHRALCDRQRRRRGARKSRRRALDPFPLVRDRRRVLWRCRFVHHSECRIR